MSFRRPAAIALVAALALAGCGSGSKSGNAGGPKSEAASAATGDIPDNQVFLRYQGDGYSLKYPEGWTRSGSAGDLIFRDKGNSIHLVLRRGPKPTPATVAAGLAPLERSGRGLHADKPLVTTLPGGRATKVRFHERGSPDPVTLERRALIVDRYVYARKGKVAILDLATPKGVDNVDAYRLISRSFRWR
ncbi:MAG: hypothetical protein ABR581_03105 [Thermoleophilaceae bacterium]